MKHYSLLFVWLMVMVCGPLKAEKQITPVNAYPDSMLTVAHIRQAALNDPDRALLMIDQAEDRKQLPNYQINWLRAQIFGGPKQLGRIALKWAEIVLQDDSVRHRPARYVNMCRNIISQLIYYREYEKALHYVDNMLQIAQQEPALLNRIRHDAYWSIAYVYRMKGNQQEAYKFIDQAIDAAKRSDIKAPAVYKDLHKFYLYKAGWQKEDHQYNEALQSAQMLKKLLKQMEPYKGGPFPEKIPEQNFQEYEAQTMLKLANLYQLIGQKEKGKELYASLEHNPSLKTSEPVINQVINYLLNANRTKEAITMALPLAEASYYPDSINVKRQNTCRILANAYQQEGNYQKAIAYAQQVFMLNDSLMRRHQEKDALELATLLETHEKENMIVQQANAIRIHKFILLTVCIMLLLCCVILVLVIRHSRIINRKNKAMAKQIDNRLFYKEELLKAHERIYQLEEEILAQTKSRETLPDNAALLQQTEEATTDAVSDAKEANRPTDNAPATNETDAEEESKKRDKQLFEELDRKIRKDNLFLNPDLNREQILQLTQIGKNRLAPLIQTFTGENFNGYINGLRLEYSLLLLKKYEHYTVEAIASDSGFNNVRTYQRLFRNKYDMTPAEYRKSLLENETK